MKVDSNGGGSVQAIIKALVGNSFVTFFKLVAWIITSSPSMLAEALHSAADVINQSLLFLGIKTSSGSSKEHPWGMGPLQYLFNLLSAVGIFTLGCLVTIWHAIHDYYHPSPESKFWWVSLIILAIAFIVEGYTCYVAFKEVYKRKGRRKLLSYLRETDDPALIAILLEDSAAMLGIMLAFCGVLISKLTDSHLPDVICAVTIGIMMGAIAWFLGILNAKLLIGKSIPPEKEEEYKDFITGLKSVEKVTELKTEVLGPNRVYLSFKAELHTTFMINIEHLHDAAEEIKEGGQPIKILLEASDRAVRSTAREIAHIEKLIKKEFPEVDIIDLELD